jgi:two-component system OmpR family response regulator
MEGAQGLKLLIVDDEPGIVDFIQKIYQRKGFTTFGVTDGIAAVDIYQKEKPEITLIDVHMPFSPIDGVETLKRIRDINNNAACIMVTRITEKEKVDASRSLGACAYLLKPFELEDLDKTILEARQKFGF